jgi:hypothetical protein
VYLDTIGFLAGSRLNGYLIKMLYAYGIWKAIRRSTFSPPRMGFSALRVIANGS